MDTTPPPRPADDRLRRLRPEVVMQRLQHGGMARLDRLLRARAATATQEASRQAARHGAESAAATSAGNRAAEIVQLARAAHIDAQRRATAPRRTGPDELVLLARLVDVHGEGVPCLETQFHDPTGATVDTGLSDQAGQVRLIHRPRGKDTATPMDNSYRASVGIATETLRKETGSTLDYVLMVASKGRKGQQRVPVKVRMGQTTVVEVRVEEGC